MFWRTARQSFSRFEPLYKEISRNLKCSTSRSRLHTRRWELEFSCDTVGCSFEYTKAMTILGANNYIPHELKRGMKTFSTRDLSTGDSFLFLTGSIRTLPSTVAFRSYSNKGDDLEQDYEDIRLLLKKRLVETGVQDNSLDSNLQVFEILLQHRKNEVDTKTVNQAADGLKPAELYNLASILYALQERVGEEAMFLSAPLFRLAAVAGDLNAKYSYGQLLRTGLGGVTPDPKEAATLFTELAKRGHPYAQFSLAGMYYAGLGVAQDFEVAYTLYKVSAESGVTQGYNMLGNMHLTGEGVDSDEVKAVEFFKAGAEKGDSPSLVSLARCFSLGKGIEQDLPKAFECHKLAADQGNLIAIYNVGSHYFAGKGVNLDMKKAAEYFQKAADQNFALAQVNLGNMFYHGLGVEKNWTKAKELYKKAAPTNHNARMLLEELESEMENPKNELVKYSCFETDQGSFYQIHFKEYLKYFMKNGHHLLISFARIHRMCMYLQCVSLAPFRSVPTLATILPGLEI